MPARARKPKEDNVIDLPTAEPEAPEAPEEADPTGEPITYPHAKVFFKSFGVDGAATLAGSYPGISNVAYSTADQTITFSGPAEETDALATALPQMWEHVWAEFKEWKKDETVQAARKAAYGEKSSKNLATMDRDFLVSAVEAYVKEL